MKLILKGEAFKKYMQKAEDASDGIKALAWGLTPDEKFTKLVSELISQLSSEKSKFSSDLDFLLGVLDLGFVKKSNVLVGEPQTKEEAEKIFAKEILNYIKSTDEHKLMKEVTYYQMNKGVGGDLSFTKSLEEAIRFKNLAFENYISLCFCDLHVPIELSKVENVFFMYLLCKALK